MRYPLSLRGNAPALAFGLLLAASGGAANAQVLYSSGSYTQNFDTLATSGSTNAFTDNSVLGGGWYASSLSGTATDDYNAGTGTTATGDLYSFGAAGSTERALGSLASGGTDTIFFGLQLRNTTAQTLTSFTLNYTGEHWRRGSNALNTLSFAYSVRAASTGDSNLNSGTYTAVPALSFTAPTPAGSNNSAQDGNTVSTNISSTVLSGFSWAPGQDLWLRWSDPDDAGNDDGLAIDNLTFSAATTAIPEAGTLSLVAPALLAVAGFAARRRRPGGA